MPLRDLVRDPPTGQFVLPQWIEQDKIVQIIDALNRGATDETDSDEVEE